MQRTIAEAHCSSNVATGHESGRAAHGNSRTVAVALVEVALHVRQRVATWRHLAVLPQRPVQRPAHRRPIGYWAGGGKPGHGGSARRQKMSRAPRRPGIAGSPQSAGPHTQSDPAAARPQPLRAMLGQRRERAGSTDVVPLDMPLELPARSTGYSGLARPPIIEIAALQSMGRLRWTPNL